MVGPVLRIFHVNRAGTPNGRPAPFGSGTEQGYAVTGAGSAWLCRFSGEAAKDCTIGYDFGRGEEKAVRSITIKWVYGAATPTAIRIEYSDDKSTWSLAGMLAVAPYPSEASGGRIDTFNLSSSGRHRYWRVKAEKLPETGGFAITELRFLDKEVEFFDK